jgi:uncharacterized membrane protein YhdT
LLYRTGQPFNVFVLTLHKLISVAVIVYLTVNILGINKMAPLDKVELIACIVTALLFLGAVVTGGVLSAAKDLPVIARTLHWGLPFLSAVSTVATLYLMSHRK